MIFDKMQQTVYNVFSYMRRVRLTITLKESLIDDVDKLIDGEKIRNRSHAIEYVLLQSLKPSISKAVILAGGQGENLRPYTYELPKSMLLIKGRPILEYLIDDVRKAEIREIIICIGYRGEKIKEYFGDGAKFGVKIIYSEERKPLGTGGAIQAILTHINNESFVVLHGDIVFDLRLADLIQFHKAQESTATVALTSLSAPFPYGQFELHGQSIVGFYEHTKKEQIKSNLVNTGVYILNNEIFQYFPSSKKVFMLESVLQKLIQKKQLTGFVFEGQWFDIGSMAHYERAIRYFKKT